jgi:hypothetical protein
VAELYLQGVYQNDIAKKFGVSQPTISKDLRTINKAWMDSALIPYNEAKNRELARVDVLEREYWKEYRASSESRRVVTSARKRGEKTSAGKVETVVKGAKDTGILRGVQWCIEQRCKILGLYEAQQVEHSGSVGVVAMTPEERASRLMAILTGVQEREKLGGVEA